MLCVFLRSLLKMLTLLRKLAPLTHSLTHSHARTGVKLNPPLPYADLLNRKTIEAFIGFLNTSVTKTVQSEYGKPTLQIIDPNLTKSIQKLDLGNGTTRLSTQNNNLPVTHAHHLTIGRIKDDTYLKTYDNETSRMTGNGYRIEEKSHILINTTGKVFADANQPFHTALINGEICPEQVSTRIARQHLLYRFLSYFYDTLANPSKTTVKLGNSAKPLNLLENQDILPQQFIDGLNGVHKVLANFDVAKSY